MCVCVCMCVFVCVCVCICICVCVFVCLYIFMCVFVYVCMCVYVMGVQMCIQSSNTVCLPQKQSLLPNLESIDLARDDPAVTRIPPPSF